MLDVETYRVDYAIGAHNGGFYGALVMCIGGDLFDVVALSSPRMPRGDAHRGAGLAQLLHDAIAKKASPPKHCYAAHRPIYPMIWRNALDGPIKRRAHCLSGLCRRTAFVDMVRNHINQDLRRGADSLPLFHGLIDQWLGFNVQAVRLFDDRLCLLQKIDQRALVLGNAFSIC